MKTWFTSDLHMNHKLVARSRGFNSTRDHDAELAARWRHVVRPKDIIWVLGDVAMGNLSESLALLDTLPGTKHLVSGNHDRCHPMHRGSQSAQRRYLEVFASVQQSASVSIAGTRVLLSHFPYTRDHTSEPRHLQWRLPDFGMPLLHGHTHSNDRGYSHEVHVGVDAWDLFPVSAEHISKRLYS